MPADIPMREHIGISTDEISISPPTKRGALSAGAPVAFAKPSTVKVQTDAPVDPRTAERLGAAVAEVLTNNGPEAAAKPAAAPPPPPKPSPAPSLEERAGRLAAVLGVPLDVARRAYSDEKMLDRVTDALGVGGPGAIPLARSVALGARVAPGLLDALRAAGGP